MDLSAIKVKELIIKRASAGIGIEELIDAVKKANNGKDVVQVFDPDSIVNRVHVVGAYANALLAFDNKTNKSDSIAMEMLLFAAMTNQIGKAVSAIGAKTSSDFILFSNNKNGFSKITDLLDKAVDFKPSISHIKNVARIYGLDFDGRSNKEFDAMVLEKITMSRLNSD